jgi:hypothetical protein
MFFHIFGAGRGGTGLVAGLLNEHSACEVWAERLSTEHLLRKGAPVEARVDAYLEACEESSLRSPKELWGHKTTTEQVYFMASGECEYFLRRTIMIPTIFVTRDGRACIPSKVRRSGIPLANAVRNWRWSIHFLRRVRESQERLLVFSFEQLVLSPEAIALEMCRFLGIPYEPAMLQGTRNDAVLSDYHREGFDRSAAAIRDGAPPYLAEIADDLRYCGYRI